MVPDQMLSWGFYGPWAGRPLTGPEADSCGLLPGFLRVHLGSRAMHGSSVGPGDPRTRRAAAFPGGPALAGACASGPGVALPLLSLLPV